ncbi:UDP-glucose 4-epimerase GalE [Isoptericola sp. 4D.3]|uniref:UDP-glucose 4-epimerase n=1 Tax=Isoptericola peretonis TaxID=2918523 RepID=A0ABT0J3D3_9MICO|nr:UDP-glucose 4-epimerase GalE [Isoptericola sp. 4D.3]
MRVLVTGGAGYVGSHTVLRLLGAGHDVVVVDDFSRGAPAALDRVEVLAGRPVPVHAFDTADIDALERLFDAEGFDAVVHLAGIKSPGGGGARPLDSYETNLGTTFTLLRCMAWYGVDRLVVSSSSAVYGDGRDLPHREDAPLTPVGPLGRSHAMNEQILRDVVADAGPALRVGVVRHFSAAGAHPSGTLGPDRTGAAAGLLTAIAEAAAGLRERLEVHGDDHPTPDGTAMRDYVHVDDLAAGHVAALAALGDADQQLSTWNLGSGRPTSVLELVRAFEEATGRPVPYRVAGSRAGDVPVSYADPARAEAELGWRATRGVEEICLDLWRWHQRHPTGYPAALAPSTPWRGGVGHRLRLVSTVPAVSSW